MSVTGQSKVVLHVGCGHDHVVGRNGFKSAGWKEIRLDIDPDVHPDITASITDLSDVATASVDAVYSSHNIEHLYPHEVPLALHEFFRVLRDDGFLLIACPDLQTVCQYVANDRLLEPVYRTNAGFPISPVDILYGWRESLAKGNLFMAHKSGFTLKTLVQSLSKAGFASIAAQRQQKRFALRAIASKTHLSEDAMRGLFIAHA